jgi:hypothetical protein
LDWYQVQVSPKTVNPLPPPPNIRTPPRVSSDIPGNDLGFGVLADAECAVQVPALKVHVLPSGGGPTIEKTVPNSVASAAAVA